MCKNKEVTLHFVQNFKARFWPILATILICLTYYQTFVNRAIVDLEIVTQANNDKFKIYWKNHNDSSFHESRQKSLSINRQLNKYQIFLPGIKDIQQLRIDPIESKGTVYIKRLVIRQPGLKTLEFETAEAFSKFKILEDIGNVKFVEDKGLRITTTGIDSQLSLVPHLQSQPLPWVYLIHFVLLTSAIFFLSKYPPTFHLQWRFVSYLLVFVIAMVMVMAVITGTKHPDEYVHISAVQYYAQHLLPPAIDDASLANTFSAYGYSRVNNFEIFYNIGGAVLYVLRPIVLSELIAARLINILLLIGLVWYSLKNEEFRYFTIPLLISAQTWYIFSYVNSEAFALFLAIILSYQAASRQSTLYGVLTQENITHSTYKISLLGFLFGLSLLVKVNFYVFLLFLFFYLLWRIYIGDFPKQALLWRRLILISLIGMSVFGVRYGWDIAQNGLGDRSEKLVELSKQYAHWPFNPETPLDKKSWNVQLKERGVPLSTFLSQYSWFGNTFASSFGAFGYMEYFGSNHFYKLVKYVGLMVIAAVLLGVLINAPPSVLFLFFITLGSALLLIGLSIWQSWTISFQPQGRYMLPILPMIGVYYYHARHYVNQAIVAVLTLALYLLATYSFIFTGLLGIAKLRKLILVSLF